MALLVLVCGVQVAEGAAGPEDFLVQVWNTDEGLPHSTVTSIAQTPDGSLWAGTLLGGLARFDGVRFVNFHPGNTPALKSIEIQKLLVDSQGTLWVGTVDGGLVSYRDGRFHFERQNTETPPAWLDGMVSSSTNSVVLSSYYGWLFRGTRVNGTNRWETIRPRDANRHIPRGVDSQGVIWGQTYEGKLEQVHRNQFECMQNPPGLRSPQINVLISDATGQIWVGTEKELAVLKGKMFMDMTPTNGEPNLRVQQMVECPDGTLWVKTDRKLRKCRGQQWVAEVESWDGEGPLQDSMPISLFSDSRGGLWVLHYGDGLWHIDAHGKVSRVREAQGLPSTQVQCGFEDREGNFWIGLVGGGLACVRVRTFHTVWPTEGVHTAARSICEDQTGTMWFGTSSDILLRWRNGEFSNFTSQIEQMLGLDITVFPNRLGQNNVERLWVGSAQNGVVMLESNKLTRPFPAGDYGTVARVIYEDHGGRLWIGNEFGLFCWEQGKLKRFTTADGFVAAYVTAFTEDAAGNVWIGTGIGELWRYQNGKFTNYRPQDTPTDAQSFAAAAAAEPLKDRSRGALTGGERFWALHADAEGVIWIGTLGGGLLRFQDDKFTRYTPREGLPNEHVSQILEDGRGQLWLGTRGGIVRVSKVELNQVARGETLSVPFIAYGKIDGLPTTECSGGSQPACWRSRDGHLWFATVKGAVWTDPAEVRLNLLPPPVWIEEVTVDAQRMSEDGQSLSGSPTVRLPARLRVQPGQHYLEFKFTALSLTSPDKVRFKWRLVGLEKDWMLASNQRSVSYNFVPPGDYEFQVQACNNDGVWNETGAALKLTVRPYFWQTWWFKVLAGLLVVAVVWTVYCVRVSRLRALERLRLRIAIDLHDEVGSNLNTISLLANLLETNLKDNPALADVTQVRDIAGQTFDSLRDIIWFISPTHDKLSDLVARLEMTARRMLVTVAFTFDRLSDFRDADLPLAFRRNVPPLFKESLHNLLKHSRATAVSISVSRTEKQFKFCVQDNGIGFNPEVKSSGNGLKNMKRRAEELGGRLEISNLPAGGTTVTLTAPLP